MQQDMIKIEQGMLLVADRPVLIGLIQREEAGDLNAAAGTLAQPTGYVDILKQTMPELRAKYEDCLRRRMAGEEIEREHSRIDLRSWSRLS